MPLDEGLAEVVAVGKDASNPPQVDPGGYREMEHRAVLHRATVYREISRLQKVHIKKFHGVKKNNTIYGSPSKRRQQSSPS